MDVAVIINGVPIATSVDAFTYNVSLTAAIHDISTNRSSILGKYEVYHVGVAWFIGKKWVPIFRKFS